MKKFLILALTFLSFNIFANNKELLESSIELFNQNDDVKILNTKLIEITKNKEDIYTNSAYLLLASLSSDSNDYKGAVQYINKIINSKIATIEQKIQANSFLYEIATTKGDQDNILKAIDNLSSLEPNNLEYKALQLGEHVFYQKNFTQYYKKISSEYSEDDKTEIYYRVAGFLLEKNSLSKSKVYLNLLNNSKSKKAKIYSKYIQSLISEKENNLNDSLKYAIEAYNLDNSNLDATFQIFKIYSQKKDVDKSIEYLVKTSELLKNENEVVLDTLANLYFAKNDDENTMKYLIFKNKINPNMDTVLDILILALSTNNQAVYEEIFNYLSSENDLNINNLYFLLSSKAINYQKYDIAKIFADKLLENNQPLAHYLLTIIYFNTGDVQKAKQELNKAKQKKVENIEELEKIINQ